MADQHPTPDDSAPQIPEAAEIPAQPPADEPHLIHRNPHPFRDLITDAAIEAEIQTGRHETTLEEAERHVMVRVARIIGGWVLIIAGIAALPLPGPGWLIILLGLSLLPYVWAQRMITIIRRRIPGIPEDGRIPTRTWLITGVIVALTTAGSLWWALARDKEPTQRRSDSASAQLVRPTTDAESADTTRTERNRSEIGTDSDVTVVVGAAPADPDRRQIAGVYAAVLASTADLSSSVIDDPFACTSVINGTAAVTVLTTDEISLCLAASDPATIRANGAKVGVVVYASTLIDGKEFWPIASQRLVGSDDEVAENAVNDVSEQLTMGQSFDGDPAERATALLAASRSGD